MSRPSIALVVIIGACVALVACGGDSDDGGAGSESSEGIVQGNVVTGPTCPVEGAGQDCAPHPTQTTVDVFAAGSTRGEPVPATPLASVDTDGSGLFEVELAPGDYQLVPRPTDPGASGRPDNVTVSTGSTIEVTLTIDTGIR